MHHCRAAQAGLRGSRLHCAFIILRIHYSHGNPDISESLRNTSENNNNTSPRKACQSRHFANTAVVTSAQPKYYCLSVDSQPSRILEIWASESKGWCWLRRMIGLLGEAEGSSRFLMSNKDMFRDIILR